MNKVYLIDLLNVVIELAPNKQTSLNNYSK